MIPTDRPVSNGSFFQFGEIREENLDDTLDEVRKLTEAWENRLTFERLSLAERYINGELRIHVNFSMWSEFSGIERMQFRAIFERLPSILWPESALGQR
jgi:hypothetical protein